MRPPLQRSPPRGVFEHRTVRPHSSVPMRHIASVERLTLLCLSRLRGPEGSALNDHSRAYRSYIASPAWRARRDAYFARWGRYCRGCFTRRRIHLHHGDYSQLGNEPDEALWGLCASCHRLAHRYFDSGRCRTLHQATWAAVKAQRRHAKKAAARRKRLKRWLNALRGR